MSDLTPGEVVEITAEPIGSSTTERMLWAGLVAIVLVVLALVLVAFWAPEGLGAASGVLIAALGAVGAVVGLPATARQGRKAAEGWKPGDAP